MRSKGLDAGTFCGRFHNVPDCLDRDFVAPNLTQPAYSPEDRSLIDASRRCPLIDSAFHAPWNGNRNRDVLHKIGVTGSRIETRLANARLDPTFLMADVEVAATYELYNINRVKLENLIHRVFDPAQLDIEIKDRFGNPIKPREWFLVPLFVVNEVVERIKDGTITEFLYDPKAARLVKVRS